MSRHRRRRVKSAPGPSPVQKFSWKIVARYDRFQPAHIDREARLEKGQKVKVHKMSGNVFAVKVGKPVKPKQVDDAPE